MPSYEQQLETYLKNHGIDASIKYNDYYNRYDITFTTIIAKTIGIRKLSKSEFENAYKLAKENVYAQLRR